MEDDDVLVVKLRSTVAELSGLWTKAEHWGDQRAVTTQRDASAPLSQAKADAAGDDPLGEANCPGSKREGLEGLAYLGLLVHLQGNVV